MIEQKIVELVQFDNFTDDALFVRDEVIAGGFKDETGPDGALYTGISQYQVPHWYSRIAELIGEQIAPRLSCFRLNLQGEMPHSWVHSDDICAKFASVLYLNLPEQCYGGTAFWKHSELDIDRLPSRESLRADGIDDVAFYSQMDKDWKELNHWQQIAMISMKFNRFITYPTCLFHSRFPFGGFGKDSQDGRLIWICFYDTVNK